MKCDRVYYYCISRMEVVKEVKKPLSGRVPEFLKDLDTVGLSRLAWLCNIAWTSRIVSLDRGCSPSRSEGDQKVRSNWRGITFLMNPGKVYSHRSMCECSRGIAYWASSSMLFVPCVSSARVGSTSPASLTPFLVKVGLHQDCPLPPILLMDRHCRHSHGVEGGLVCWPQNWVTAFCRWSGLGGIIGPMAFNPLGGSQSNVKRPGWGSVPSNLSPRFSPFNVGGTLRSRHTVNTLEVSWSTLSATFPMDCLISVLCCRASVIRKEVTSPESRHENMVDKKLNFWCFVTMSLLM